MKTKPKQKSARPVSGAPCFRIDKSNHTIIATTEEFARQGVIALFEDGQKRRLFCRYDAQTDSYIFVCQRLDKRFERPWYLSELKQKTSRSKSA
jgi:hypothetical protein